MNLPTFTLGAERWPRYANRMRLALLVLLLAATAHADTRDPRDPVHLRAGTLAITGTRYMKDMVALSAEIDRRTRGSVSLDWVGDGQLGEEAAMAALVREGKLAGGGFSETGLVALIPEMAAWSSPGLFHTYDDVDRATAALDATVRERFEKDKLVFVMWADLGFARVFSTDAMPDLTRVLAAAASDLALPIDGTLTSAIAKGRVRTWALPPLYTLAIGAKARHMANLRYRYVIGGLVFSQKAWSRLTTAEQAVVRDVCRAWEPRIRTSWRKETERGIAALEKTVKTHAATEAEIAAFVEMSTKERATVKAPIAKLQAQIVSALAAHR